MLGPADLAGLTCPRTGSPLTFRGRWRGAAPWRGVLQAAGGARWPVRDGIPRLVDARRVLPIDRVFRRGYDVIAPLHDALVVTLLPALALESTHDARERYMRLLALDGLAPRAEGPPLRVLEVGIGGGGNLPYLARHLPAGAPVEVWGADLSLGMLAACLRRQRWQAGPPVRLVQADAHHLPFRDGWFDRVFHVGGIGAFGDPARALAEMARVARPGTPIVVVDEALDPTRDHHAYQRLAYRVMTLHDPHAGPPVDHLPPGASEVVVEHVGRFYYALRFVVR